MADILLDIRDLSVVYATEDGVVRALNKATLQLHKGETLGSGRRNRRREDHSGPRHHAAGSSAAGKDHLR